MVAVRNLVVSIEGMPRDAAARNRSVVGRDLQSYQLTRKCPVKTSPSRPAAQLQRCRKSHYRQAPTVRWASLSARFASGLNGNRAKVNPPVLPIGQTKQSTGFPQENVQKRGGMEGESRPTFLSACDWSSTILQEFDGKAAPDRCAIDEPRSPQVTVSLAITAVSRGRPVRAVSPRKKAAKEAARSKRVERCGAAAP